LRHAVLHQLPPLLFVVEGGEGTVDGIEESLRRVGRELESSACAKAGIPFLHSVVESAGRTHNGHGSILEGVDLVEAAGLEAAGHEENIRAGFDFVGEGIVVTNLDGEAARVCISKVPEKLFVLRFAGSESDDCYIALCKAAGNLLKQVEAFLRSEAGADTDDGRLFRDFETEGVKQILTALALA